MSDTVKPALRINIGQATEIQRRIQRISSLREDRTRVISFARMTHPHVIHVRVHPIQTDNISITMSCDEVLRQIDAQIAITEEDLLARFGVEVPA